MADELSKEECEKYKGILLKNKAEFERLKKIWESRKPVTFLFTGLVKHYMDAVKHTNGLISAKPSCTTALQAAEKNANSANLNNVMKALGAAADEAVKNAGKDPAKAKTAATFKKELGDIVAKVKKFETT